MPPASDDPTWHAPPAHYPDRQRAEKPQSIRQAVLLMWVGAALSLIGGLVSLLVTDVDDLLATVVADSGGDLDIDTAKIFFYATLFIGLALGTGLWIWMAIMNDKGKKWARVVATVFFAIAVLSTGLGLLGTTPVSTMSKVVNVISLLVGLGAIVLMYRPESSRYYEQMSTPRY